jgi:hypothetical protein
VYPMSFKTATLKDPVRPASRAVLKVSTWETVVPLDAGIW